MKDRPDPVLAGHELRKHSIVDESVFWVRLEDPVELNQMGNIFQPDQPQTIEGQQPHANHIVVARVGLPVHGNPDHIGHDL
jgi:hypothetical protein